ncbi:MAG: HAMP domain-containing sensor histidine kinase, partial [Bacteroidota bacterium]
VTERMVGEIEEASNRIAELVLSVKSYTHMDQAQDKQPVNVHQGIKSTVTMLAHKVKKGNITIEKEFQEGLSTVMGFPGEMNQVFTNILDNAIDALRDREGAKIVIKTVADNDFLRVYFRDNGPGIPEDVMQKIFDPFFTTKAIGEGTGMGLDVVKKVMDHHNGKVEVKSEPGATEFCLCFPIHE